jgi:CheY-like chemotaxis protein
MARTILLADDSPTIRKIVELTFGDSEIRVVAVASGQEAMERLDSVEPDLVLADVVMPAPTGYDICESVKSSSRPVPVLLLAGSFEPFDHDRAEKCGADGHLVKPFESQALQERVASLLYPELGEKAMASELELELVMDEISEEHPPGEPPEKPQEVPRQATPEIAAVEADPLPEPDYAPGRTELSDEFVDAVARAVVRRLSRDVLERVVREIVPELAASIIRQRIRELEAEGQDED